MPLIVKGLQPFPLFFVTYTKANQSLLQKTLHMKKLFTLKLAVLFIIGTLFSQNTHTTNRPIQHNHSGLQQQNTVLPHLQLADQQFQAFMFEEPSFMLDKAVAENPDSPAALIARAKFKKVYGMQNESRQDYALAKRLNPYSPYIYGYYGNAGMQEVIAMYPKQSMEKIKTSQVHNYYYEALDSNLIENAEEQSWPDADMAISLLESENYEAVLPILDKAIKFDNNAAIAWDLKGFVLFKLNRYKEAENAFVKALEIDPEFAIAWYNLGLLDKKRGNLKMAETYLDKAIEIEDDLTKAYFARAEINKMQGDLDDAVEDYDEVIDNKGTSYIEAYANRGLTKKILGDFNGAIIDINKAIEDMPDNADLYKNRGNLYLLFGDTEMAIDDYTTAIRFDSDYAEAYYNRGLAYLSVYDKVNACYDLERAVEYGYKPSEEIQKYFCTF